jgi:tRNA(Ile)-lysidine synthase
MVVNIRSLKQYLRNNTLIYELFKPFGITGSMVTDLDKIINGETGGQLFTGTYRFLKNRNEIIISAHTETKDDYFRVNSIAGLRKIPGIASVRQLSKGPGFVIPSERTTACLDLEKITFPVIVRNWLPGDFFYPLGMKKKKKLSDYFIDQKFSRLDKENVLIVESDNRIAWIVGERIDNRFKVTDATRRILIIKSKT